MRNTIALTFIGLFILVGQLASQTILTNPAGYIRTFQYELLVEAPIFECNILGRELDTSVYVAPKGAVFEKISAKGNHYVIRFMHWKKEEHLNKKFIHKDSTETEQKFFLLDVDEFNAKAVSKFSKKPTFTIGASTLPLRIRTGPFDFSGTLSYGTNFGIRFQLADYQDIAMNIVSGLHITHIILDSLNTQGRLESSDNQTAAALSPAVGVVFEFSKAQVGTYLGWDFISGSTKENWIYQGKPWFSIGVGISLFNVTSVSPKNAGSGG
ncbi:MAG: hypothetical protein DHS20C18_41350 [Saprospiraceae bacterium]|nr:MAG: hypothetical protein DHS20C18_41350 [Saprospiraceae bacterium]